MQCKGDIDKLWLQIDSNLCDIYLMAGSGESDFIQEPFEDFYEVGEEIGRWVVEKIVHVCQQIYVTQSQTVVDTVLMSSLFDVINIM